MIAYIRTPSGQIDFHAELIDNHLVVAPIATREFYVLRKQGAGWDHGLDYDAFETTVGSFTRGWVHLAEFLAANNRINERSESKNTWTAISPGLFERGRTDTRPPHSEIILTSTGYMFTVYDQAWTPIASSTVKNMSELQAMKLYDETLDRNPWLVELIKRHEATP